MNPKNTNPQPTEDDHLFDLLVDGQLDDPRRRELLSGLDDRPGGWRQCAMAFLEAQSWREAMDALTQGRTTDETTLDKSDAPQTAPQTAPRKRRRTHKDYVTMLLGMAASFLLAIGVTSWMHQMYGNGLTAGGPGQAKMLPVSGVGHDVQLVNLPGRGPDGRPRMASLPAVERNQLDEKWLRDMPSAIPAEVAQQFQRAGHDVQSSRRLVPFRMKDGRRLVVPVDQLDVNYVSNPGYQ